MDKKFRHFYLYAKGHYKETNIIEDLKKIAGAYTGSSPESERLSDIMSILTDIMNDRFKGVANSFDMFSSKFLQNTSDFDLKTWNTTPRSPQMAYIHTCLEIMGWHTPSNVEELGEPDYTILEPYTIKTEV